MVINISSRLQENLGTPGENLETCWTLTITMLAWLLLLLLLTNSTTSSCCCCCGYGRCTAAADGAAAWLAHLAAAAAGLRPSTDKDALVVILGINDLHINHARAQTQELQVITDY
jgi:hypothetical protein